MDQWPLPLEEELLTEEELADLRRLDWFEQVEGMNEMGWMI